MSMARADFDVVVVGAGVVGATLALALAQQRLRVAVVETRAPQAFDPDEIDLRVFALSPASAAILHRLQVWDPLLTLRVSPYRSMRVWERDHADELSFDAAMIGTQQLGWIVEDRALKQVLWQALSDQRTIERLCPASMKSFEPASRDARIVLDDGRSVHASLVVAADGAWSPLRESAGIEVDGSAYGERAVVAHVTTQLPHQCTAWQRFTPQGPLALLPLDDGRCSVVWSLKDARATSVLALDDAQFCAAVEQAFDARLGKVTATTPRAAFALRLQLAQSYIGQRLALVGDAAHVFHPLAGQGLNQGLLDAAALAEVLGAAHARRDDPGATTTLVGYETWRRGEVARAARAFDLLDGLFRSDFGPLPWLRRAGMSVLQRMSPLKRELALHASGFAGRVPALAQRLP